LWLIAVVLLVVGVLLFVIVRQRSSRAEPD
jgi:cytochrome c-type biogenesis protein CcmH/NrfF